MVFLENKAAEVSSPSLLCPMPSPWQGPSSASIMCPLSATSMAWLRASSNMLVLGMAFRSAAALEDLKGVKIAIKLCHSWSIHRCNRTEFANVAKLFMSHCDICHLKAFSQNQHFFLPIHSIGDKCLIIGGPTDHDY